MQIIFLLAQNFYNCNNMEINFWSGTKKFGPAQNILGPIKGQGITVL
jgi:hypothetical protein